MNYKTQLSHITSTTVLKNITEDSINYILSNISRETKFNFILHIVENNFDLELAKKEIEFYDKDVEIIKFPEWNTIPYDINSPSVRIQTERMEAIYKLLNYKNKRTIFLVSKNSLVQKVINEKDFRFINLSVGQKITVEEMRNLLESNCYSFSETSNEIGDYSINNNTIDLITFDNRAYRIILGSSVVEEIKSFNPDSQISYDHHDSILVLPVKEVIFSQENAQNFRQNYRNNFGVPTAVDAIYDSISSGVFYDGCENWLPLFYNNELKSILDFIPKNSLITYSQRVMDGIREFIKLVGQYYNSRLDETKRKENKNIYNPVPANLMYSDEVRVQNFTNVIFDTENVLRDVRQMELHFEKVPDFFSRKKEVFGDLKEYLDS